MTKLNRLLPWPLVLCMLLVMSLATTAFAAPDVPSPDSDAAGWIKALYTAVTAKEWGVVTGLALVGLVYVARRWLLGWVTWFKTPFGGLVLGFLVALASTLGVALGAGATPSLSLVMTSLSAAATAAGVWEWLKAHVPGMQTAADKAATPEPSTGFNPRPL
jgi:hypothetical protein